MRVVAGILENVRGEILLCQRPPGKHLAGLWEFPGGKVGIGEIDQQALVRELREELELDLSVADLLHKVGAFSFTYLAGPIELIVFRVRCLGEPRATLDVQNFRWVEPFAIDPSTLSGADVEPLRTYLKIFASGGNAT